MRRGDDSMPVKYTDAKRFALSLPGVSEEPHFGVPSFRVQKRILVTVPPGDMLHVFVSEQERDMCLAVYADCTEKLLWGGKVVGIRIFLDKATRGAVEDLVLRAWKYRAPKKDVAAYEGRGSKVAPNVDAYIAGFPAEIRARLEKVRGAIRKAAPEAEESISYRIPAYRLEGALVYFAGFAQHIGMYPAPRSSAEFRDELAPYGGGKGTVQFPHDEPLPLDLIKRIVKFRAAENLARAVARKTLKAGKAAKKTAPAQLPAAKKKRSR